MLVERHVRDLPDRQPPPRHQLLAHARISAWPLILVVPGTPFTGIRPYLSRPRTVRFHGSWTVTRLWSGINGPLSEYVPLVRNGRSRQATDR